MFRRQLPFLALAGAAQAQGARPRAVVSFTILGDMLRQLAADRFEIRVIAGPEADPHSFQPRPSDVQAFAGAALAVRNGLGFDAWFDRLARSGGHRGTMVTATEGMATRTMLNTHSHGHSHDGAARRSTHRSEPSRVPDPHGWQDVTIARLYARNITAGLIAADAPGADAYRAAAAAYDARLAALDTWVRERLGSVPAERRRMVTSHDALGYFGEAYGVTILTAQGISTDAEPTAQQMARLIRQVRAENITAIFIENTVNPAALRRLAREAGAAISGRLFTDALSPPNGPAATYEAMMRHNVGLMVPAMLGQGA